MFWDRKCVNFVGIFLVSISIAIAMLVKILVNNANQYEEPQLSQTLQKIVEYGTNLHLLELRTLKLLREDPYANLVETKLMPAHKKMQSIKKQTKIYEDMKRIPGGPQNFMSTSLNIVEEIRKKVVACEVEYYRTNTDTNREITVLDREIQKCWNQAQTILTENDLRLTLLRGIFLNAPSPSRTAKGSDSDDHFPKDETRTFEDILDSLSHLSDLSSKFEKVKSEFERLILEYNITEPDDIYDTPAYPLAKELSKLDNEMDTKIRDENYQAFIPYVRKFLKQLDKNLREVQAHLAKTRMRYENLAELLETDQTNLRNRIKKLRF